ncbi:MAG TPA: PAS domain S-box protein [Planctomycetaceae bacterium]|jgi:PAS domain S-box-containing protein|nr:PAS domain S-box protein [Planctomycetaceae bacterium]
MDDPLDFAATDSSRRPNPISRVGDCILDELPTPFCLIGFDGRFQRVNAAWCRLLGQRPQGFVGKSFARFIHPDDAQLLVRQLCDPNCEGSREAFEAQFRCGDGRFRWFHCETKPIIEQKVFMIVGADITERKEAEDVAKRRVAAVSLKADIWGAFGGGASSDQILGIWTDLVQRHLDVPEVQIWTRAPSGSALILHARTGAKSAGESCAVLELLKTEVRQVGETDAPLVIPDVACATQFASRLERFQERAIRGVILHPVRTAEHVLAILVVFFAKACGAQEAALIETIAAEIGNALARLLREEELQENRRDRDRLLGTTFVGFCRIDAEQKVVAWNEGAERILGWNATDVLGLQLPIATDESRALLEACLSGALLGRSTERVETKLRTQSGRTVEVALAIVPLFNLAGNVNGAWLTVGDLTERKRCEHLLALQSKITEDFGHSPSVDEATRAVLGAVCTRLGWEVAELWKPEAAGGALRRTASWHSADPNAREFDLSSQRDNSDDVPELAQQHVDANVPRWLSAFSSMRDLARSELAARCGLHDAIAVPIAMGESGRGVLLFFAGEIDEPQTSLLNFLTTISEQLGQFLEFHRTQQSLNDARQDLLQAKKMDAIGRLVGGVAHDFNNLLTIILGYGEIVLDDCEGSVSNRELIGEVLDAGKRAAGLTKQLLGFCRKEAAEPTAVDLNAHIAEMQKMISRLIGEHITLTTSLAPNAGFVQADPAHIEQVVMNLAVNARDAMPNGGTLSVETRGVNSGDSGLPKFARTTPGRYVLLSVRDTGSGMDEATRKRIFEPFFTTKGSGKGTGMGLATVFEIIRQYDGQVDVESTPGSGTTFHILFPSLAQDLEPWQVDSRPVAVPRGDETILLVEDDDRVRQLMMRGLTAQGYRVFAAGDPTQALELCKAKAAQIDLLIADVMLPTINGQELALRVAALNSSIRVLYVSGYGAEEVHPSDLLTNGAAYLQKPFSTYELARKVREVCDSQQQ